MNVGVLGRGAPAQVDGRGRVTTGDVAIDWLVGAGDRWHEPGADPKTRQHRDGAAPVVETAVRVPGGDVAQRVYGAAAGAGVVTVIEVENRSPVPLTVGFVLRLGRTGPVTVEGPAVRVGGVPVLAVSRPPGAWAAGESAVTDVTRGDARTGPVEAGAAPIGLALLFPVPHRTCVRAAAGDLGEASGGAGAIDVRALPGADAVARGWERQLDRGLRARLPAPIGELVDAARADLLLAPRRGPSVVAALEDWGFDEEAACAWAGLGGRDRRRARQRRSGADPWSALLASDPAGEPDRFLAALRAVIVRERAEVVDLLPGFPPDWLGQSITVEGAPLRAGSLSFAVRWHGARPALLWDAPSGVVLRAPALDPAWSSQANAGEALLAEPPRPLLAMGTTERSAGDAVDAPGQFT